MKRTIILIAVFILGFIFHQASVLGFMIRYLVMLMLFIAFLNIPLKECKIRPSHIGILLANLGIAFGFYYTARALAPDYALVAFISAITPTAIATPVVISIIHRNVAYVATAVLMNNIAMAFILPLILPTIAGADIQIDLMSIVLNVFLVVLGPLALGLFFRFGTPKLGVKLSALKPYSFYIWVCGIFLISAKTTAYLKTQEDANFEQLITIAGISLAACIISFAIGALLGGKRFRIETAQALGQKNNMLTIWISLTYLNPLVALGPTFYVLWHNLYNAWLVYKYSEKK